MGQKEKRKVLTDYLDRKLRPIVGASGHVLNLAQGQHPVNHAPKHDMLPVEEVALGRCDEELAPIRVWPRIGLQ